MIGVCVRKVVLHGLAIMGLILTQEFQNIVVTVLILLLWLVISTL